MSGPVELRPASRGAFHAAIAAGVVVVLGIEVLSRLHAITRTPMGLVSLGAVGAALVVHRRTSTTAAPRTVPDGLARGLWALVGVIGLVTLVIALVAAPNTWDSMTYHLPRVAHWAAQQSVEHYPTAIDRQLWQPPFAEYLVLVPWVLGAGDRLANVPSWLAGAGCVLAAAEIAALVGLPARGRALAALIVATTPTVVLEATSTQTDLVAACWIAIVATLALAEYARPGFDAGTYAWIGAAAGLAVGTKGTSMPLVVPWILLALAPALQTRRLRAATTGAGLIGLMILALNLAHFLRNTLVFNGPLGPPNVQALLRPASLAPLVLTSNLVANLLVHVGTPWAAVNDGLTTTIAAAHRAVGLDVRELYPFFGGFGTAPWTTHENVAGNPVQLLLSFGGMAVLAFSWRTTRWLGRALVVGVAVSFLLFAATVRWQPFNARLETPIFVLAAPCLAALVVGRSRLIAGTVTAALVLGGLPALFANATRPVLAVDGVVLAGVQSIFRAPRTEQYFASRRDALDPFVHLAATTRAMACPGVALATGYDGWEYPLWVLLAPLTPEHAFVVNASTEIRENGLPAGWCLAVIDERPDWQPPATTPPLALLWSEGRTALWREVAP